jgi:O-antigen ligase/tetratricopeptide (TPR) repeat protein
MQTDNTLKYIIYTLLGFIFLVPFVVDSSQLFPFITGKAFVFRILAELIFFVWLILAIRNPEYRPRFSFIMASVTAFVVLIGISNIFGANPFSSFWSNYERMEGYINILHLFAMFLAIGSTIKTKEEWNKFILTSFIISIGIIYISFKQYFGAKEISQGGDRLDANFGNPIYLAIYNIFHIFFGLYLIFAKGFLRENWQKISILIIIIFHLFCLYNTNTRGAVVGLLGGLFLAGIINIFTTKKESKKIWFTSILIVSTISVMVLSFILVKDSQFVKNNKVLVRFAEISVDSGTSQARLLNWGIAIEGFKERPILGWGMGNYSYVFDKYYVPEMYGNESWFDHVHNIVFDWLIAGGAVGLVLYLLVLLILTWTIWRNTEYTHLERNIFIGLVAAYFIQNLFVFDNQVSYIYFFILLAIFHSQKNKEISIFTAKLNKNLIYVSSLVIWVLLPVTIYFINAPGYFASTSVIKSISELSSLNKTKPEHIKSVVENIINRNKKTAGYNSFASFEIRTKGIMEPAFSLARLPENYLPSVKKQEYINFAFDEMKKEISQNSDDSKTNYIMGLYLNSFGDYKNANVFLDNAVKLSPNKQVLQIALAQNYLRLEQKEKAIEVAKKAYELAEGDSELKTKYDSLWIEYVKLVSAADQKLSQKLIEEEIKAGRGYRAEMLFKKGIETSPDNYQNYVSLSAFYFSQNNKQKSLETLKTAKEKFPKLEKEISRLISDIEAGKKVLGDKY